MKFLLAASVASLAIMGGVSEASASDGASVVQGSDVLLADARWADRNARHRNARRGRRTRPRVAGRDLAFFLHRVGESLGLANLTSRGWKT